MFFDLLMTLTFYSWMTSVAPWAPHFPLHLCLIIPALFLSFSSRILPAFIFKYSRGFLFLTLFLLFGALIGFLLFSVSFSLIFTWMPLLLFPFFIYHRHASLTETRPNFRIISYLFLTQIIALSLVDGPLFNHLLWGFIFTFFMLLFWLLPAYLPVSARHRSMYFFYTLLSSLFFLVFFPTYRLLNGSFEFPGLQSLSFLNASHSGSIGRTGTLSLPTSLLFRYQPSSYSMSGIHLMTDFFDSPSLSWTRWSLSRKAQLSYIESLRPEHPRSLETSRLLFNMSWKGPLPRPFYTFSAHSNGELLTSAPFSFSQATSDVQLQFSPYGWPISENQASLSQSTEVVPDLKNLSALPSSLKADYDQLQLLHKDINEFIDRYHLKNLTPLQVADRLPSIFQKDWTYTLDLNYKQTNRSRNFHDFFTSDRRGHCEFFATATVMILRQLGIASRYARGFYVHEWNDDEQLYWVRSSDAHAWALFWNDQNNQWTEIDTTPSGFSEPHYSWFQTLQDLLSHQFYILLPHIKSWLLMISLSCFFIFLSWKLLIVKFKQPKPLIERISLFMERSFYITRLPHQTFFDFIREQSVHLPHSVSLIHWVDSQEKELYAPDHAKKNPSFIPSSSLEFWVLDEIDFPSRFYTSRNQWIASKTPSILSFLKVPYFQCLMIQSYIHWWFLVVPLHVLYLKHQFLFYKSFILFKKTRRLK